MGHKSDWWEKLRVWLVPKLGVYAQLLEDLTDDHYYVEAELHNNQFVGRVDMPEEEFEKVLDDLGFERNPLAALKTVKGEVEEGSWRKVGYAEHPDWQLHVILFDGSQEQDARTGYTYVYAHWEIRWDAHPWQHYRAKGFNPGEGVRRMKKLLDQAGVHYKPTRP